MDALVMVVLPVIVREDTVVVASVEVPRVTRLVAVALVAVRLVKMPVIAVRSVEKKLLDVALVIFAFVP